MTNDDQDLFKHIYYTTIYQSNQTNTDDDDIFLMGVSLQTKQSILYY